MQRHARAGCTLWYSRVQLSGNRAFPQGRLQNPRHANAGPRTLLASHPGQLWAVSGGQLLQYRCMVTVLTEIAPDALPSLACVTPHPLLASHPSAFLHRAHALQSQLDFGSLGGDLLLEVGNDPLGLLSPLQPRQQASQFAHRPSSGVSSVKPAAQPGSSTAAGAAAVPARLASAAHSSQAHTVSSMQRHIDAGEISFLRSPRSVPALFKSPEEQHAVGMQQRQQQQRQWRQQQQHQHQQRQQYQPRRPSLFSPGSAFSPAYQTPLADLAAHSMAVSTAPAPQQAPEVQGRNLVLVDTAELASADSYVQQVRLVCMHCGSRHMRPAAGHRVSTHQHCSCMPERAVAPIH